MTRLIPSTMTLAVILTVLTAPTPASAKYPWCSFDVHGAEFTRPVYEAGRWASARLDVSMRYAEGGVFSGGRVGELIAPETEHWRACAESWVRYITAGYFTAGSPMMAFQDDPVRQAAGTRQSIGLWPEVDTDDVIAAGWIDPLQAGGAYVLGQRDYHTSTVSRFEQLRFEVAPNPDADVRPPEPVGLSITYGALSRRGAVVRIEARDASSAFPDVTVMGVVPLRDWWWLEGTITLRRLGGGEVSEHDLRCTGDGLCNAVTPLGATGRHEIERVWLSDRFHNGGDVVDHPIFDGVIIDLTLGVEAEDLVRGTLAPDAIGDVDPTPDDIDDEGERSPEPDEPAVDGDDVDAHSPRPIDPIEDEPEEPAPTAARRSADGCSAAPGGGSVGGGLVMLAVLVGWRRRAMR